MLYYPATQFLGIYKNTHTRIVIEALFIIAPNWGLHICLSTIYVIGKHIMVFSYNGYYPAIKKNKLLLFIAMPLNLSNKIEVKKK